MDSMQCSRYPTLIAWAVLLILLRAQTLEFVTDIALLTFIMSKIGMYGCYRRGQWEFARPSHIISRTVIACTLLIERVLVQGVNGLEVLLFVCFGITLPGWGIAQVSMGI